MAESVRPPVAIRIVRPYASEDELLEHELETLGKTSVVLIGAHPRPTGVILRFEVTLASGATVLRGEGRVLAHKDNAFRGQPGLTLRFTRLDPRSKAVVDRATAMREARSSQSEGSPSRPAPRDASFASAESPIAEALTASTPAPSDTAPVSARPPAEDAAASQRASAREKANATARTNAKRTGRASPIALTPPPVPVETAESAPAPSSASAPDGMPTPAPTPVTSVPGAVEEAPTHVETRESPAARAAPAVTPSAAGALEAPPDRAELLERLRERAGKLGPERVEEILSARR